jgi:hypothetical protein
MERRAGYNRPGVTSGRPEPGRPQPGPGSGQGNLLRVGYRTGRARGADYRRKLHRSVIEREAHLVAVQDQLDAERTEINRIDLREGHQVADTESDRSAMAARRWADAGRASLMTGRDTGVNPVSRRTPGSRGRSSR